MVILLLLSLLPFPPHLLFLQDLLRFIFSFHSSSLSFSSWNSFPYLLPIIFSYFFLFILLAFHCLLTCVYLLFSSFLSFLLRFIGYSSASPFASLSAPSSFPSRSSSFHLLFLFFFSFLLLLELFSLSTTNYFLLLLAFHCLLTCVYLLFSSFLSFLLRFIGYSSASLFASLSAPSSFPSRSSSFHLLFSFFFSFLLLLELFSLSTTNYFLLLFPVYPSCLSLPVNLRLPSLFFFSFFPSPLHWLFFCFSLCFPFRPIFFSFKIFFVSSSLFILLLFPSPLGTLFLIYYQLFSLTSCLSLPVNLRLPSLFFFSFFPSPLHWLFFCFSLCFPFRPIFFSFKIFFVSSSLFILLLFPSPLGTLFLIYYQLFSLTFSCLSFLPFIAC